ncbi:MAG: methylamine utilization protein MauE [bacterium]|nr:methylamine utilization protein MauE [bacterium]
MDPAFSWILRGSLAALFAVAAAHKLRDLETFGETLRAYQILGSRWVAPAGAALVLAELGVAIALILSPDVRVGAAGAVMLLGLYSFGIGFNLARGRHDIDCGCLGPSARSPLSGALLVRNGVLAIAAMLAGFPAAPRALHPIDAFTIGGGLVATVFIFIAAQQLAALAPGLRSRRKSV